jgi:hypothetical protein
MLNTPIRTFLPKPEERLRMGKSALRVSPLCIGMVESPDVIPAAFEAGINFFFISADLHWPLYEHTRQGVSKLLKGNKARRDEVVVGVVSYLDEPLFGALQFNEVLDEVPGLDRIDLMIAGAVSENRNFYPRLQSLAGARQIGHVGASALGASFHQRELALVAANHDLVDIMFTRYNTLHPGARNDLYPYLHPRRAVLNYNFKSMLSWVPPERLVELGFTDQYWMPDPGDCYRFALTQPGVDGVLCSPGSAAQVKELVDALDKGPLRPDEEHYMITLSSIAFPQGTALYA